MFVALQKSPNGSKFCSYEEKKRRKKSVFKLFGLVSPKDVLRKTRRSEKMVVRRKSSSRSMKRSGSFKEEDYSQPVVVDVFRKFLYLVLHFILVVGTLLAAAVIFTKLADSTLEENVTRNLSDVTNIWNPLEKKYNISISGIDRELLSNELRRLASVLPPKRKELTRLEVFKKWFYFASIASTTIGYGDVAPSTREGRIIYIIFSFIAIPLMLSFIVSCGDKIRRLHVGLLSIFKQWLARQQTAENSSHLLASLLIFISFSGHVSIGCTLIRDTNNWTLLDKAYHHIATFTTVGLGDVIEPLEEQIDNVVALFMYRVFGLALLFAALKSLYYWYEVRREACAVKKLIQRPLKSRGRISTLFCLRSKLQEEPKLESTMLI